MNNTPRMQNGISLASPVMIKTMNPRAPASMSTGGRNSSPMHTNNLTNGISLANPAMMTNMNPRAPTSMSPRGSNLSPMHTNNVTNRISLANPSTIKIVNHRPPAPMSSAGSNLSPLHTNNLTNRLPTAPMMAMNVTPTKIELMAPNLQQGQLTPNHFQGVSPGKPGIASPTKIIGTKVKKTQAIGKSPIKPGINKAMGTGKSPSKIPGKPGLIKPAGTVTPASNAAYKEWKGKFGSHDDQGFHCNMCPERKTFTADSSLRRHYTQSHEQICKTCKMEFSEEHLLQQHYQEKHEFKCMICFKVFTAFSSVRRHHEKDHPGQELPKGGTPIKSEVRTLNFLNKCFTHTINKCKV